MAQEGDRMIMTYIQNELDWNAIEVQVAHDEWRGKRDTDIFWCMKCSTREVYEDGTVEITNKPCNEPDCPTCGPRIRKLMKEVLTCKLEQNPLRKITLTGDIEKQKKERARIIRKYGKKKVSVFVTDILTDEGIGLETEILIDTSDEIGIEYVTLTDDDVYKWSQKAFNGKKSGNLHKDRIIIPGIDPDPVEPKKPEIIDEPVETIEICILKTDCEDKEIIEELEEKVLEETKHLDPKTFDELRQALIARRQMRQRVYEDNQIVILSNRCSKVTAIMSRVEWLK